MGLQVENGEYTRIVNEVLEQLVKAGLLGAEYQVVFHVIRKTYGWGKIEDTISLSQFQEETGLSRATIVKTLKNLVTKNILVKAGIPPYKITYKLNKYWKNWVVKAGKLVKSKHIYGIGGYTKTSIEAYTHKRKKETNTKEIRADKPLKDKFETNKYPKDLYVKILNEYQRLKGIKLQGEEFLPLMAEIKRMFKSGRTVEQINETMGVCEENYEDWAMTTVRMKIADVVGGKLRGKDKNKSLILLGATDI